MSEASLESMYIYKTFDLKYFFFFIRKTEEHEMTDFSDKPDEMSMAQQNLNPSSSKKWKMITGTIFVILIIVVSLIAILPKINSTSGK
jgi:hypothetical protein